MSGPVLQFNTCEGGPSNPCTSAIRGVSAVANSTSGSFFGGSWSNCSPSLVPDMVTWVNNFDFDAEGWAWGTFGSGEFKTCSSTPDTVTSSGYGAPFPQGVASSGYSGYTTGTPDGSCSTALWVWRQQVWVPAGAGYCVYETFSNTHSITSVGTGPYDETCGIGVIAGCSGNIPGAGCSGGIVDLYCPSLGDFTAFSDPCNSAVCPSITYVLMWLGSSGTNTYPTLSDAANWPYSGNPPNAEGGYYPAFGSLWNASQLCHGSPDDPIYGTSGGYP